MREINYRSDFDFVLRLKDCADPEKTVPFPACDWDAVFWTSSKANRYTASYKDGVYTNCLRTEDGGIRFIFDNHRMGKGTLKWEPHFELPNGLYPDGLQDIFSRAGLDIRLVDGPGDCPTTEEIEVAAPFIKGDKGDKLTYADLTAQDKADLIAPIKDDIDKDIDALRPLPFVFGITADDSNTDVAVYFRDERKFYRLGEVIAPEELGYNNEDPETGEVTASTRRQFICGNRLYRFTGIDFVDVAVERSTERRLVRKTPSINSHPGLVYINKNIIRLPQPGMHVGDVARIRLDGMYFRNGGTTVPLSECTVEFNRDCLSVELDGGSLVVTRTRDCSSYDDAARSYLFLTLGRESGIQQDPHRRCGIGVRYDGSGRKIFYVCSQSVFPASSWTPGEEELNHVRKNCVDVDASCIRIRCQRGSWMQVQLWTKTRSWNNGVPKCRWRWRGGRDTFRTVWRDHCLVRIRRKHGGRNGVWSEWGYVHVMRVRTDNGDGFKVRWSRQERK